MRKLLSFACVALIGCGGRVTLSTSTTSSSGAGGQTGGSTGVSSSSGGGASQHGDCASDADCAGKPCVALTPGGYRVCESAPPPAAGCGSVPGECCTTMDCMGPGNPGCYDDAALPLCGGVRRPPGNACIGDDCEEDADCGPQSICTPPRVLGRPNRACMAAFCHTDADCTRRLGGVCRPILNQCCSIPRGLACMYPGGCSGDDDCRPGDSSKVFDCMIDPSTGESACTQDFGCPP